MEKSQNQVQGSVGGSQETVPGWTQTLLRVQGLTFLGVSPHGNNLGEIKDQKGPNSGQETTFM